ncbi:hypothetical protein [Pelagicoccus sp. SDUM812003]|uniref:hypothetical protein n=1 Tax=Pelagicoccus sp. SDUM812003 TaxID=3041267 RepID=UPI00280EF7DB|nr:hypothetical protein [Pelagicoccus sp. SDUM812003]MDQ8204030.1 hypothetical protein [Pelagicoccus sp. SDUM812003]
MKRAWRKIGLLPLALLATSCAGPNLAQRIDEGMRDFDSWPEERQEMIRKGEIDLGFTEEQVRMAWGDPDYVTREVRADGEGTLWVWEKKSPRIGIGVGVGGWGGRSGVSGSVGTSVGGDHRIKRTVWFQDGEVQSFSE